MKRFPQPLRKILAVLPMLAVSILLLAQENVGGMSREQFRKYKENYLQSEIGIDDATATRFFPLYEEFQDKKQALYTENRQLMDRAGVATEAEYRKIIDRLLDLNIESEQLEKRYYEKFSKILTYKQLFKLNKAEETFQKHMLKQLVKRKK